ncbi:MAG: PAS domain S-box protein [Anaerolineaceae bacterium]|nr:PAS domain S-box protein [Anaerolineaceae bacterium]
MNYLTEINNLTELVLYSSRVKLKTDLHGQIQEVYAQELGSSTFLPISILVGKLLSDCSNLELVREIFETIEMVNKSNQPAINLISFSSRDELGQIDCEVFPFPDQKFLITLTLQRSETEEKAPGGHGSDLVRKIGEESFETNLHFLLDRTQNTWFAVTETGKFVQSNKKFLDLIGYPHEYLENITLSDLLVTDQKETINSVLENISYHTSELQNLIFLSKSDSEIKTNTKFIKYTKDFNQSIIIGIVQEISGDSRVSLKSAEDQFIKIVTRVPIPIILVDELSLEIFFSNPFAKDYFEYNDDELTKLNLFDLFPSSENHYLVSVIRKGGVLGLEANYSWRLMTKAGLEKTARFLIQQIDYENRRILMVIILDQEEDTKLNFIKEDSKILNLFEKDLLVVGMTPDGIITRVNQSFCDLLGRPLRKIIGSSVEENLFEGDYERVLNHVNAITLQNPIQKNKNRIIGANGKTYWIEWTDKGIFDGERLVEIYGLGKDITEIYQQELLQKSMEQRYQALVEKLPMVTYVIHAKTFFPFYISPQVEKLTGYTPEEFYKNPEVWINAMHPDDAKIFYQLLQERIEKNNSAPVEFRMYHKDGRLRWVEETGSTIELSDGTVLFQGVSRDVTARHNAREKLIYYSNFERLINEFSLKLMNATSGNLSEIIKFIVDELGKFMQVDRAYIFDFDYQNNTMSNTFEWCNEGISSQIKELQNLSLPAFPWIMERITNNQDIIIEKVSEIPEEAYAEKESFIAQEIKSLLIVPFIYNDKAQGLIGFDMVKEQTSWEHEAINLLRLISTLIISASSRIANQSNLKI